MKKVVYEFDRQNVHSRPLEGEPYYTSSGIIYALDRHHLDRPYAVGQVDYQRFDDHNFQYVFTKFWSVIDALPFLVFNGISGLDMDLRLEKYYRSNMTPGFITERTPPENRENIKELLDAVSLDHYDRFEWLLRAHAGCGVDNLIVERKREESITVEYDPDKGLPDDIQPYDTIVIKDLKSLGSTNRKLRKNLIKILSKGADIYDRSEERLLSKEEESTLLKLAFIQEDLDERNLKDAQKDGIEKAKKEGKYRGRKRQETDMSRLKQTAYAFEKHWITEEEAMKRLNINSRSTFYRRLKEVRNPEDKL